MTDNPAKQNQEDKGDNVITIEMSRAAKELAPGAFSVATTGHTKRGGGLITSGAQRFATLLLLSLISFSTLIALLKRIYEGDTGNVPQALATHIDLTTGNSTGLYNNGTFPSL